ncbi:MAG: polysaccharide biosynthesis tyrosine autokinase, partial [Pseudomonadota bacterium]
LTSAERRLESFKSRNDLFDADGRFILDKQLAREMEQLVVARNRTTEARARYEQARQIIATGGDTSALEDVLRNHTVRALRDQLARSLRSQAQLKTKYGPLHPALRKANADVAKARSELVNQINSITANFKTELGIAEARQAQLASNLISLKQRIAETKEKTWELEELTRDATTSRKLYETMLGRAKQLNQSVGLQFPDARFVQRATVPLSPAGPKRKQYVLLALIAGLMLAFGSAFLFEMLRPGFESARETEKELMVEQVAALPAFSDASPADPLRNARFIVAQPQSLYAEAMRSLAHVIQTRRGSRQVVLMMSSLSGEGRSTTASNLAAQFAVSGQRVLIVDADLREGGLSRTFGLSQQPGVADIISGAVRPSAAILRDATTGLHVLPSSPQRSGQISPVELLSSAPAYGLFDALRSQFDLVIVDAPPLLPVADARVLSDICDSALMVVKWRKTARGHVKQALRTLGPNQSKVIGIVMSGVEEAEYVSQMGLRTAPQAKPQQSGARIGGLLPGLGPAQATARSA